MSPLRMTDKHMSRKLTEIHAWVRQHATELQNRQGVCLRLKLYERSFEPVKELSFKRWLYNHKKRIEATPRLAAQLSAIEAVIADAPRMLSIMHPRLSAIDPMITRLTLAAACLRDPGSYQCGGGEAALLPWDDLPFECGFKRLRPGRCDKTRHSGKATVIDKEKDRQRYAMSTTWAMKTCGVTDAAFR